MKLVFIHTIVISFFLSVAALTGCGSGEYDIDEYEVNYTEKTLKVDTIKKISEDDSGIKENKKNQDQIKDDKREAYTYVVQIGAFIIKSNFDRFYDNAKTTVGNEVYYDFQSNLYKIRIGKFKNRAEAILMLDRVKKLGYSDAFIITRKN